MTTVKTDSRRDFASRVLASPLGPKVAWRRAGQSVPGAVIVLLLTAGVTGCSWLGSGSPRVESRQQAPDADAFAHARAAMAGATNEPYWPHRLGELYVAADSSAVAIQHLNASLAIDPGYAPAISLLSRIYYDAGMYAQGADLLETYLAAHPDAPDALRASLALHCEAMGDGARADAALAACAPDGAGVQNARVLATLRNNDTAAMMEAARHALDADGKNPVNHNNYGIALLVAGHPVEARDAFRAALAIDDALPGALYNMAIVEAFYFFDDGAGRDWYTRYRRVASDDPDNLKAHFEADISSTEPAHR